MHRVIRINKTEEEKGITILIVNVYRKRGKKKKKKWVHTRKRGGGEAREKNQSIHERRKKIVRHIEIERHEERERERGGASP